MSDDTAAKEKAQRPPFASACSTVDEWETNAQQARNAQPMPIPPFDGLRSAEGCVNIVAPAAAAIERVLSVMAEPVMEGECERMSETAIVSKDVVMPATRVRLTSDGVINRAESPFEAALGIDVETESGSGGLSMVTESANARKPAMRSIEDACMVTPPRSNNTMASSMIIVPLRCAIIVFQPLGCELDGEDAHVIPAAIVASNTRPVLTPPSFMAA